MDRALASPVFDEPQGVLWDSAGLLLVKYGFVLYALVARTGELSMESRAAAHLRWPCWPRRAWTTS